MEDKPANKRNNTLGSLITGSFLVSRQWVRNWPFIIYLSLLALVMISSSHSADRKVHHIADLRSQMKELSSEYIDTRSRLMVESMESKVVEKASEIGLVKPAKPPVIIKADN